MSEQQQDAAPGAGNAAVSELVGDALPDPSLFSANWGDRPQKKKRHAKAEEVKTDVNINSLLDILSVILVFLLKSFATSTVQVKPSPELQIPFSQSSLPVEESVAVTLTLHAIMVNDAPVALLEAGAVPKNMLEGNAYMIGPLLDKLRDEVARQKQVARFNKAAEFKGIVTIIADRNVPFKLLTQVMYTVGQAEFSKFKFATIKASG